MTSQPSICSAVVQALVGTIWPLKYASDYRPYFTIHDAEFKEYTSKTQAPWVLGLNVWLLFLFVFVCKNLKLKDHNVARRVWYQSVKMAQNTEIKKKFQLLLLLHCYYYYFLLLVLLFCYYLYCYHYISLHNSLKLSVTYQAWSHPRGDEPILCEDAPPLASHRQDWWTHWK